MTITGGKTEERTEACDTDTSVSPHAIDVMARLPEFHFLMREEVERLAGAGQKIFKPNQHLLTVGKKDLNCLIVLLAGECAIESSITVGKRTIWTTIETVTSPDVIGEVGLFTSQPRTANVVATKRSVAIVIPENTLLAHFESSRVSLPKMLWSFGQLSLMRARAGTEKLEDLSRDIFGGPSRIEYDHKSEIKRLETLVNAKPKEYEEWRSIFFEISKFMVWLNGSLAYACYLAYLSDPPLGVVQKLVEESGKTLSPLTMTCLDTLQQPEMSFKMAVVETLLDELKDKPESKEWRLMVEAVTHTVEDALETVNITSHEPTRRNAGVGSSTMVEEFTRRVKRELDKIEQVLYEHYKVDQIPEHAGESTFADKIAGYINAKLLKFKIRRITESGRLSEMVSTGEVRDFIAEELYHRIAYHPVIKLHLSKFCEKENPTRCKLLTENESLQGFICSACQAGHSIK